MNAFATQNTILSGARRLPYVSLLLGGAALLLSGVDGADRFALNLMNPELIDLVLCHWVHWSGQHLLWSGGAFVLLGSMCEGRSRGAMLRLVASSVAFISAGLLLVPGEIGAYGGLSGIDSAFFGYLVVTMHQDMRGTSRGLIGYMPLLCGIGFAAKMGYEVLMGEAFFVHGSDGVAVVPLAHVVGFGVGTAAALRR